MLKVEDIHTYYGNSYVLQGVNIEVKRDAVVSILGRNGMGKTTLMRSVMGFNHPRRGKIIYRGVDITGMNSTRISRNGIGLVPQGKQIFPSLTVEENLKIAFRGGVGSWNLEKIYEVFSPLEKRKRSYANRLSGGEQQMLAIGRSLMTNPSLLLMDEPTEGLAPIYVEAVGKIIGDLHSSGLSILISEHRVGFALYYSDFIYIMSKGKIVHSAPSNEIYNNTEVRKAYLGV
jgi:branched-chain amino acid transport system ATP-binding protein